MKFTWISILAVFTICLIIWSCKREPIIIPSAAVNNGGNNTNTGSNNTNTSGQNTTVIVYVPINNSTPCNPDSVYFNQQILPILVSNCASSGCHDIASRKEGVILTNYEFTLNTGKVNLLTPTSSNLYRSLNGSGGIDLMPPSPRAQLSASQKALILKWIQQGGKNLKCDDNTCDSTNFTFAAKIKPIIDLKCLGCHNTQSAGGGISYSTYQGIKTTVDNGKLWGSINHLSGYKQMPQNYAGKIPDCEIVLIKKWIQSGAPNN